MVGLVAMLYREYAPHTALRPYVRCLWSIVSTTAVRAPVRHRVLPDGCLDIVFMGGSGAGTSHLVAVGAMTAYIVVDAMPVTLGVRFEPGAAAAFLRSDVRELTDRQVDLDDLWGPEARHLHECLEATGDDVESRVGLLQSALLARLAAARGIDPMVNSAVDRILTARGRLRVGQLHRALGVGERRLRRRFVAAVGLAPKQLARIARFRGLVSAIERSGAPRWADAALEAGYYDQAHMIADFHELSGQAPTEFLHTARVTTPTP